MKGLALRIAMVVGMTAAAGLSVSAAPTALAPTQVAAWCAVSAMGSENCGFTTQAQCVSAVTGLGGFCRMTASVADQNRRLT